MDTSDSIFLQGLFLNTETFTFNIFNKQITLTGIYKNNFYFINSIDFNDIDPQKFLDYIVKYDIIIFADNKLSKHLKNSKFFYLGRISNYQIYLGKSFKCKFIYRQIQDCGIILLFQYLINKDSLYEYKYK